MSRIEPRPARPVKDYWFTHGLQQLSPEKFLKVVGKILVGEHVLLRFPCAHPHDSLLERGNEGVRIAPSNGRIK